MVRRGTDCCNQPGGADLSSCAANSAFLRRMAVWDQFACLLDYWQF